MKAAAFGMIVCLGFASPLAAQDAKVAKGEKLYGEQKCAMCHSIGDKGNKKGPLDGVGTKLKAEELRSWLVDTKAMTAKSGATRKPDMKSYDKLAKDDVDALVAYMQTLKK